MTTTSKPSAPTDDTPIVELTEVGCRAGKRSLLRDVNWKVRSGEHWVVFGMNGSGKTTLLSIVAGYRRYTEGKVRVFGEPLCNENALAARKRIGMVSASFFDTQYTRESALDIVLSGLDGTLGRDRQLELADVALAKAFLAELGLAGRYDQGFDMFSKGERQNILIARALIGNPDMLILDEPCTGLDVYNRSYLFNTIAALSERKSLTIVYVTHYTEEITPLFDKCLLLRRGQVFAQGATEELMNSSLISEMLGFPVELTRGAAGGWNLQVETTSDLVSLLDRKEA